MAQVDVSWAQFQAPEPQPMDRGYPPGSFWYTFPAAPPLGLPVRCVNVPPAADLGAGHPGPATPRPYRLRSGLYRPLVDPSVPPGTTPDYGSPVLNGVSGLL